MSTNYVDNDDVYKIIERKKSGTINIPESSQIRLVFIQKGACSFFFGKNFDVSLENGNIVLVPPQNKCVINVKNNIRLMIVCLTVDLNFCNNVPLEALVEIGDRVSNISIKSEFAVLKVNKIISDYFKLMEQCLSKGMKNADFTQIKQKELLYYLGEFYSKEELYRFFKPILTRDVSFSKLIYSICENKRINSIKDLVKETNYSVHGFKKRFKSVFGIPAYQWLCEEKAKKLFHEITCTHKTFTLLAQEFGFSSPAHMNNFSRKMFGDTPGNVRAKKLQSDSK
ncbi:MAG: helix-turn-helix domain-containing protein [Prevotellaceae bacterium]|jgi:AraC-like DNA-binding protein|nr:helix-turn-helix domain-containing protein [Prevotellaceae bacterium]